MTRLSVFFSALLICIMVIPASAAGPVVDRYTRVQIHVPDRMTLDRIGRLGIDFEGSSGSVGGEMEFVASEFDRTMLTRAGISYSVVIQDIEAETRKGLHPVVAGAQGFGTGSMGGYYTYAEVVAQLDSMHAHYPTLVSAKYSIGQSVQGRDLWMVRIGLNPAVDDTSKPQVLYTALHHAREPGGMMTVLYYMWWLLDHYSDNAEAAYLVNNRIQYFLPVVNPDGYTFNQSVAPSGGGMWRKNRRNNGDGTDGVDLNRNYGPSSMWNAPNGGSATTTESDTYRGPAPFSEPETRAIEAFLQSHRIVTCLNYHTYGNYLIYPYGAFSKESPDSVAFREFAFDMTAVNRYKSGTDMQTVNYTTRGASDDYMYGDSSKPRTFAMTPEANDNFWASTDQILPTAEGNRPMNLYLASIAGQYSRLLHSELAEASGNGNTFPDRGESVNLDLTIRNKGLGPAHALSCAISIAGNAIQWTKNDTVLASLPARTNIALRFSGSVSQTAATGVPLPLVLTLSDPSGYMVKETVMVTLGTPVMTFADDAETGASSWVLNGWDQTWDSHSGYVGYTDSPNTNYAPNCDVTMTQAAPMDLSGMDHAVLKFWTKWEVEPRFDFARAEISTDGGDTWNSIPATFTRPASGFGVQVAETFGFDGYTPGMDWVEASADLSLYVGTHAILQFRLTADGQGQRNGWYLDDIRVYGYRANILSANGGEPSLPKTDQLLQNFPNPFNPTTNIVANLKLPGRLTVEVYDLLGRPVATIIDRDLPAGSYTLPFNGAALASGVYWYRMAARHPDGSVSTLTKSLILAR